MRIPATLQILFLGIVLVSSKLAFAQNAVTPAPSVAPLPGNGSDYVYIRQRISANYQNAAEKLARILVAPVEKEIYVKPGDTLSSIVSKQYKVGVSNAPAAFQLLANSIMALNRMSAGGTLQSNTNLKIPNLPPLAATNPNPNNQNNDIPKLSIQSDILLKQPNLSQPGAPTPPNVIFDEGRKGAQEVVMIQRVTRAYAQQLVYQSPGQTQVMSDLIPINFAQASVPATAQNMPAPFLSGDDATMLRNKLASAAKKHPVLIIFDDAWPDDASFVSARNFFVQAITEVRQHYMMGSANFPQSVMDAKGVSSNTGEVSSASHASLIKRSLMPLQTLEPTGGRVSVIFLPLFNEEPVAAELFTQLIEMDLDAKHMAALLGFDAVPPDVVKGNRKIAEQIVKAISSKASDAPPETDQALIAAMLTFCELYSNSVKQPYVLNMSWTTPNMEFPIEIPEDGFGIDVVAAGNEGDSRGTTVYQLNRQFASRSLTPPGDMLAVMNIRDDGTPDCMSSLLVTDRELLGFSFPGRLSDTKCGTSFSAPRVAWLIAAHEAMTPQPQDVSSWKSDLYKKLISIRDLSSKNYNKIRLNIESLFNDVSNSGGAQK
ncbi:Uncharacterised protein [Burkholderia pseudomallei]|nr:Uncharacterised protein [Burkholderia pseudomallei]